MANQAEQINNEQVTAGGHSLCCKHKVAKGNTTIN